MSCRCKQLGAYQNLLWRDLKILTEAYLVLTRLLTSYAHKQVFVRKQNLCICVGTNKDEGLSWTLPDAGQSVLLNSGMSGFSLKFGGKRLLLRVQRLILFIHNPSTDRKFKIRPVFVRNLLYLCKLYLNLSKPKVQNSYYCDSLKFNLGQRCLLLKFNIHSVILQLLD